MLIVVDPGSGVPVYRQIMDQVSFQIASGVLKPGDELPSTRALSENLGVNPMTVSKAYSYLERDGVMERRPGRPLVVREFPQGTIGNMKLEQLREALAPVVTVVQQLGFTDQEAIALFEKMLGEAPSSLPGSSPEEEKP
jgi:GntR family transcriptional regulator